MKGIIKKIFLLFVFAFAIIFFSSITVHATDNENARYLMDAEALSNGKIAVLYIKGGNVNSSGTISDGGLYLGTYNPTDNSFEEIPVGETAPVAKEAALAVYGNTAHVVYTTSEDKIAYTYQTTSGWTEEVVFASADANGDSVGNTLSCPDIAVDSNGKVHISYIDKDGAGDDDYHKPDGMYATNVTGTFVVTAPVSCTGYGDSWGRRYDEIYQPLKITVGGSQTQLAYSIYTYDWASGSGAYREYNFHFVTSTDKALRTNNGGKVYEVRSDGTNYYTLVSQDSSYFVVNGNEKISDTVSTSVLGAVDMTLSGEDIYYAAIDGTTLLFYQDGTFIDDKVATTAMLSDLKKVATVVLDGNQYIIYTGADENNSLVISKYDNGDLTEYLVPNAPTVYTVSFNTNEGSAIENQEVNEGETATRPATNPTKEGYTFVNWYLDEGLTTVFDFSTPITEETTIYAKWEKINARLLEANTVSFKDNLRLNFLAELYGDDIEGAYVILKYNHYGEEREVTVPINVDDKNGAYYRFRCELTASEMTINVTAELYLKDSTEPVSTFTRSIRDYLIAGLNNSTNDVEKDLFMATLNYGGYTQKYFNYNGEPYAYEGYMDDVSNINITSEINFERPDGFINGIKYYGASVFFRNAPYVRYYFKLDENADISNYTFKIGNTNITPTEKDGKYYIESEPNLAYELDKKQEVKVIKDNQDVMSFDYSIITWAKIVADNSNNNDEKNMVKSLYAYYLAAKNFKDSNS